MHLKFAILCSLAFAGPLQAQGNPRDWERPGPAAERAMYYAQVRTEVNQMLARWKDAWHRDDAKSIGDFYAEDAIYLPPGETVHARRAIIQYFQEFLPSAGGADWQMLDFGTSGELAYVTGRLSYFDPAASGGGRSIIRTEMLVCRRDSRGRWLIQTHMVRTEMPEKPKPASVDDTSGKPEV